MGMRCPLWAGCPHLGPGPQPPDEARAPLQAVPAVGPRAQQEYSGASCSHGNGAGRAAFRLQAWWHPESSPALIFCKGHLCGYSGEDIPGEFSGLKSWVCPFIPVQSPAEFSRLPTPQRLRATQEEKKKYSVARLPQRLEVFGPSLWAEARSLSGVREGGWFGVDLFFLVNKMRQEQLTLHW